MAALQAHGSSDYFKEMSEAFKKEDLVSAPMKILFTKDVGGYTSRL